MTFGKSWSLSGPFAHMSRGGGWTFYFLGALWESLNNSSKKGAQLLWAVELVMVAEAQVTQAGLWPEGEKPGRVPQGGGAGALGRAQVTQPGSVLPGLAGSEA